LIQLWDKMYRYVQQCGGIYLYVYIYVPNSYSVVTWLGLPKVLFRVDMSPEDMDSFIFCIASKRSAQRLSKEMYDLNTYCPEKRPADKYDIPGSYFVMSEVSQILPGVSCLSVLDLHHFASLDPLHKVISR
jgi:hypothetical protein